MTLNLASWGFRGNLDQISFRKKPLVPEGQEDHLDRRIVAGVSRCLQGVTDPALLVGFGLGATAFHATRAAIMPALMRSIPFAARMASSTVALVPEVGTLWATAKLIQKKTRPQIKTGAFTGDVREIMGLGMTLGLLKSVGFIFGRVGALAEQGKWGFLPRHPIFWQQAGMLFGIMAGHSAEVSLGWREPGDASRFLMDSLITFGQFNLGGILSQRMFPALYRLNEKFQTQMEARGQSRLRDLYHLFDSKMGEANFASGEQLATAGINGNSGLGLNRWNNPIANIPGNNFAMSNSVPLEKPRLGSPTGQIKSALVIEGGGMRGAHTGGALNALRDHGLTFDIVTGSSAGSVNAAYWVDGYPRLDLAWRSYLHGDQFIRYRNAFLGRPLLNMDYLFYEVFKNVFPLNIQNMNEASLRLFITITDCETGRPYYVENRPDTDILGALFAGAAMPFAYPLPVKYGERLSADGGISDSIPFQKALDHGATNLWVILTRPKGFRKSASRLADHVNRWKFGEYPALVEAMVRRSEMYNDQLATIERLEREGRATVIRPAPGIKMHRLQRNQARLHEAIDQGYKDAMLVLNETGIVSE